MEMRHMVSDMMRDIRKITKEYQNKNADLIYGEVISIEPLKVKINVNEGNLIIDEEFLSLTTLVRDFEVEVDIEFKNSVWTEQTQVGDHGTHGHEIKGIKEKQKLKIYLGLKQGETVMLLRVANGQHYIILDRDRDGEE